MIDQREFRRALGSFATGVTVVTARGPDGVDVGVTANSFNSVSLDPPLVLWSLNKASSSLSAFLEGGHFAVHILSADQKDFSARFGSRNGVRFADLEVDRGVGGVPLLRDCTTRFQCRLAFCYDGGDHQILVGEVVEFAHQDRPPLVYHGGRFGHVHAESPDESRGPGELLRLISRVYHRLNADTQRELADNALTPESYWVLHLLGVRSPQTPDALKGKVVRGGRRLTDFHLEALRADDFIRHDASGEGFELTARGRETMVRLAAVHAASEEGALAGFDRSEVALLKQFLERLFRSIEQPDVINAPAGSEA
ncbi:flavin reductase domain protein FMN-binding protein [Sphingobium chlorophenolicum L-1]|uniref:Flavin reductase domain protein FMN-binding protein n=1 Tax=Sphingobium chlorophenolicum L-1 TaxID=690566 RepID=F6F344_SPHCR|nr:flavin reductase [Sphingobium chlorophenolicum]AEG50856.1 flavin reductase domain protein FMN-binding protein [Sphingobium chlorophenolicum L-1]